MGGWMGGGLGGKGLLLGRGCKRGSGGGGE